MVLKNIIKLFISCCSKIFSVFKFEFLIVKLKKNSLNIINRVSNLRYITSKQFFKIKFINRV